MRSHRSIQPYTVTTVSGSKLGWPSLTVPKAPHGAATSMTPGPGAAPTTWKELRRQNGRALGEAEAVLESLLLRYLSKPLKQGGAAVSSILLSSHLSLLLRRQPAFQHVSRQKIHNLVSQLCCSQLNLFYP